MSALTDAWPRLRAAYLEDLSARLEGPGEVLAGPAVAETAGAYRTARSEIRELLHLVVDAALDQVEVSGPYLAENLAAWLDEELVRRLGRPAEDIRAFCRAEAPRLVNLSRLKALVSAPDPLLAPETAALGLVSPPSLVSGPQGRFKDLLNQLPLVADNGFSVLITGETGTGKELVARRLHQLSPFKNGPFVPVDCAALPEHLIEAELFGHEKGAFTGAFRARPGKVEMAAGGTLFLDEVAELPVSLQVKLLRFLQERVVVRLGGGKPQPVRLRVIAATSRDLERMMAQGGFRQDLFHRLAVIPLTVPPLRDRREDLPGLIDHFLTQACLETRKTRRLSAEVKALLLAHEYPGNVRELMNFINHLVALTQRHVVGLSDLPEALRTKLLAGRAEAWMEALADPDLPERTRVLLAKLLAGREGGLLSNADLRGTLGCSDTTAKTTLLKLARLGLIVPEGEKGGRRYRVTPRGQAKPGRPAEPHG